MSTAVATAIRSYSPVTIHRSVAAMRALRKSLGRTETVGFVPTMGALHEGHLSLVRQARADNDIVVASIFVNPTQFGPNEDFNKYPRQLEEDTLKLSELGVDHLFAPDVRDMYGKNHVTYVDPEGFDDIAEGEARPGHFRGVATIVTKLFNIVQPTTAYFGQKDAAQCVLIQRIVQDLNMDINIVVKDTIREADGLAMSSRNVYLKPEERKVAPIVYRSLRAAWDTFNRLGKDESIPSAALQEIVASVLKSEPLISSIQYVAVDSKATMRPLSEVSRREGAIISLAITLGSVRLIDNIVL